MQPFTVITPVQTSTREQVEIVVQSFSRFYFSLTGRRRTGIKLVLIDRGDWFRDLVRLVETCRVKEACQVVLQRKATLPQQYRGGSFLVFLLVVSSGEWVNVALENEAPVIGYEGLAEGTMLDNSCAMLVPALSREQNVEAFSEILKMVYFDPGALKMLRRGARKKYRKVLPLNEAAVFLKVA